MFAVSYIYVNPYRSKKARASSAYALQARRVASAPSWPRIRPFYRHVGRTPLAVEGRPTRQTCASSLCADQIVSTSFVAS